MMIFYDTVEIEPKEVLALMKALEDWSSELGNEEARVLQYGRALGILDEPSFSATSLSPVRRKN